MSKGGEGSAPDLCSNCSKRNTCEKPCKALEQFLPSVTDGAPHHRWKPSVHVILKASVRSRQVKIILENYSKLHYEWKQVVYYRYVKGYTLAEIGYIMDRSARSVEGILYRIRKKYG